MVEYIVMGNRAGFEFAFCQKENETMADAFYKVLPGIDFVIEKKGEQVRRVGVALEYAKKFFEVPKDEEKSMTNVQSFFPFLVRREEVYDTIDEFVVEEARDRAKKMLDASFPKRGWGAAVPGLGAYNLLLYDNLNNLKEVGW